MPFNIYYFIFFNLSFPYIYFPSYNIFSLLIYHILIFYSWKFHSNIYSFTLKTIIKNYNFKFFSNFFFFLFIDEMTNITEIHIHLWSFGLNLGEGVILYPQNLTQLVMSILLGKTPSSAFEFKTSLLCMSFSDICHFVYKQKKYGENFKFKFSLIKI
jgi:hypothetical protein